MGRDAMAVLLCGDDSTITYADVLVPWCVHALSSPYSIRLGSAPKVNRIEYASPKYEVFIARPTSTTSIVTTWSPKILPNGAVWLNHCFWYIMAAGARFSLLPTGRRKHGARS